MSAALSDKELKLEAMDLISKLATTSPSASEQIKINRWRTQSPQHSKAWEHAEQTWQLMATLNIDNITAESADEHVMPFESNPISHQDKWLSRSRLSRYWQHSRFPTGIAASLILVFSMMYFTSENTSPSLVAIHPKPAEKLIEEKFSNYRNQQHSIYLDDGSTVYLNFNSVINVSINKTHRNIELVKGEAFFEVAKDPSRPFIVKAGNTSAAALGTAFAVKRDGEAGSQITITEGRVKVEIHPSTSSSLAISTKQTAVLQANESITSTGRDLSDIKITEASIATAWRRGVLVFNNTPLEEVLAEIERYTAYAIQANLGHRADEKITGTFFINQLDEQLSTLIASLDLIVISNKREQLQLGLAFPGHP
ncbi:MAG: FecR domain-containing protein [Paraglaciecola sp.]|uniref:FecR family protein n=1 Tax=Paraglaciecola sp. TaxID=1920173 RepID=UPI0032971471